MPGGEPECELAAQVCRLLQESYCQPKQRGGGGCPPGGKGLEEQLGQELGLGEGD